MFFGNRSRVQRFKVQRFTGSEVHGFRGSRVQGSRFRVQGSGLVKVNKRSNPEPVNAYVF